jgi:hypothetical protein
MTFVKLSIESIAPNGRRFVNEIKITRDLLNRYVGKTGEILSAALESVEKNHDNALWVHGTGRSYMTKPREQWTPDDVRGAIDDGYYVVDKKPLRNKLAELILSDLDFPDFIGSGGKSATEAETFMFPKNAGNPVRKFRPRTAAEASRCASWPDCPICGPA